MKKLDGNYVSKNVICSFEQILKVALHGAVAEHLLCTYLSNYPKKTSKACWTLLLKQEWNLTWCSPRDSYGVSCPGKLEIYQHYADIPQAVADWDGMEERFKGTMISGHIDDDDNDNDDDVWF